MTFNVQSIYQHEFFGVMFYMGDSVREARKMAHFSSLSWQQLN